jgi:hemoglobin-like flavoprotein
VYAKLFARYPDMRPLFVRDTTGAVRGEMLARTIDAILDYLDGDHYATNLIRSESVTHDGYGVPPQTFSTFYAVLAATVEEVLGAEWTPAMADAWRELLDALSVVPAA